MADKNIVGSPKSFTFDGVTFSVAADSDPQIGKPRILQELLRGSGKNMLRILAGEDTSTGWTIQANGDELEQLKAYAESLEKKPYSYTMANGDVWGGTGWITYDALSAQNGTVNITVNDDGAGVKRLVAA